MADLSKASTLSSEGSRELNSRLDELLQRRESDASSSVSQQEMRSMGFNTIEAHRLSRLVDELSLGEAGAGVLSSGGDDDDRSSLSDDPFSTVRKRSSGEPSAGSRRTTATEAVLGPLRRRVANGGDEELVPIANPANVSASAATQQLLAGAAIDLSRSEPLVPLGRGDARKSQTRAQRAATLPWLAEPGDDSAEEEEQRMRTAAERDAQAVASAAAVSARAVVAGLGAAPAGGGPVATSVLETGEPDATLDGELSSNPGLDDDSLDGERARTPQRPPVDARGGVRGSGRGRDLFSEEDSAAQWTPDGRALPSGRSEGARRVGSGSGTNYDTVRRRDESSSSDAGAAAAAAAAAAATTERRMRMLATAAAAATDSSSDGEQDYSTVVSRRPAPAVATPAPAPAPAAGTPRALPQLAASQLAASRPASGARVAGALPPIGRPSAASGAGTPAATAGSGMAKAAGGGPAGGGSAVGGSTAGGGTAGGSTAATPSKAPLDPSSLSLTRLNLSDLSGLTLGSMLVSLDLSFNSLESLGPLAAAPQTLRRLNVSSNRLRALDSIGHLVALEELLAGANIIASVSLPPMPSVRVVSLHSNALHSLEGLGAFPALRSLNLDDNGLNALAPRAALASTLRSLSAQSNRLVWTEMSEALALPALERLFVSFNAKIGSLSPARGCSALVELVANSCGLRGDLLSAAIALPALASLSAEGCRLTGLGALPASAPALTSLSLANNSLDSVAVLASSLLGLPALSSLDLRLNPMTLPFYPDAQDAAALAAVPASSAAPVPSLEAYDAALSAPLSVADFVQRLYYRSFLVHTLPRLAVLDAVAVLPIERTLASSLQGRYAAVFAPVAAVQSMTADPQTPGSGSDASLLASLVAHSQGRPQRHRRSNSVSSDGGAAGEGVSVQDAFWRSAQRVPATPDGGRQLLDELEAEIAARTQLTALVTARSTRNGSGGSVVRPLPFDDERGVASSDQPPESQKAAWLRESAEQYRRDVDTLAAAVGAPPSALYGTPAPPAASIATLPPRHPAPAPAPVPAAAPPAAMPSAESQLDAIQREYRTRFTTHLGRLEEQLRQPDPFAPFASSNTGAAPALAADSAPVGGAQAGSGSAATTRLDLYAQKLQYLRQRQHQTAELRAALPGDAAAAGDAAAGESPDESLSLRALVSDPVARQRMETTAVDAAVRVPTDGAHSRLRAGLEDDYTGMVRTPQVSYAAGPDPPHLHLRGQLQDMHDQMLSRRRARLDADQTTSMAQRMLYDLVYRQFEPEPVAAAVQSDRRAKALDSVRSFYAAALPDPSRIGLPPRSVDESASASRAADLAQVRSPALALAALDIQGGSGASAVYGDANWDPLVADQSRVAASGTRARQQAPALGGSRLDIAGTIQRQMGHGAGIGAPERQAVATAPAEPRRHVAKPIPAEPLSFWVPLDDANEPAPAPAPRVAAAEREPRNVETMLKQFLASFPDEELSSCDRSRAPSAALARREAERVAAVKERRRRRELAAAAAADSTTAETVDRPRTRRSQKKHSSRTARAAASHAADRTLASERDKRKRAPQTQAPPVQRRRSPARASAAAFASSAPALAGGDWQTELLAACRTPVGEARPEETVLCDLAREHREHIAVASLLAAQSRRCGGARSYTAERVLKVFNAARLAWLWSLDGFVNHDGVNVRLGLYGADPSRLNTLTTEGFGSGDGAPLDLAFASSIELADACYPSRLRPGKKAHWRALICVVKLGRCYSYTQSGGRELLQRPSEAKTTLAAIFAQGYDSVRFADETAAASTGSEVFVLATPNRAVPCYLIEYGMTASP